MDHSKGAFQRTWVVQRDPSPIDLFPFLLEAWETMSSDKGARVIRGQALVYSPILSAAGSNEYLISCFRKGNYMILAQSFKLCQFI